MVRLLARDRERVRMMAKKERPIMVQKMSVCVRLSSGWKRRYTRVEL
jgi:hypothetical protein